MEHSQKDCVTVTKQVFANLRGLKSFQVSFLITVVGNQKSVTGRKLEISQINEIKQYTFEEPMGRKKKSKGKLKNILTQMKMETQYQNLGDTAKAVLKTKFIRINTYN